MPDPSASTFQEQVKEFKRERVFEAARTLFFERGFRGTSLDAIAERLEVTKPFIYYYYRNKKYILADICLDLARQSYEALSQAQSQGAGTRSRFVILVKAVSRIVCENREGIAIYLRDEAYLPTEARQKVAAMRRVMDDGFTAIVEAGIEEGIFDRDNARLLSNAVIGMVNWMYLWFQSDRHYDVDEMSEFMAKLALRMVGDKASAPGNEQGPDTAL